MEDNHRYFRNHKCRFFPCHPLPEDGNFNCLFCYCPLYVLGKECGGKFKYSGNVKVCIGCGFPHIPENYDIVVAKIKEMNMRGRNADFK
ncbi:MAG: cysteine-rich small domain-containing protein [Defluviitaleaceae bacterium]|nr:cysteine-rich small domain-containing protein [Defluviitaleaceae bacterium]